MHQLPPRKRSSPSSGAVSVVPSPHELANLNLTPSIPMSHHRHHHHHHHHHHHLPQQQQQAGSNQLPRPGGGSSRTRASGSGEIVEVQGGHIVRSMGRKDRHSKVCTSKGPRDRRVRLSAHTAIQFYDVQDRLGYDRPSKAVDWLIKNAKAAIDELAELPPWQPTTITAATTTPSTAAVTNATNVNHDVVSSKNVAVTVSPPAPPTASYNYAGSDLLPPSLQSDAIADTIKFFFPAATTVAASSSSGYPPDLLSRASNLTQDLRLSLQSFHDPVLIHSHSPNSAPLAFGAEQNPTVVHWNPGGGSGETFDLAAVQQQELPAAAVQLPHAVPLHQLLVQGTAMTQRGPLQSNSPQSFRARIDPTVAIQHAELSGFASGGFPGFCIPTRIHGEDEHVAGVLGKPPSSSPPSSSRR